MVYPECEEGGGGQKKAAENWTWGSWWWSWWAPEEKWGSSGARGSQELSLPPARAEPTAGDDNPQQWDDFHFPARNHGEDLSALRVAAMTPVSFMPQRHVTMALGRPVVVLIGF